MTLINKNYNKKTQKLKKITGKGKYIVKIVDQTLTKQV